MSCEHKDFKCSVAVNRLEDIGRFTADVTVNCAGCGLPFRFIGLPAGVDLNGAAVSGDACEARLAIAPKGEVIPAIEGGKPAGFSVRNTEVDCTDKNPCCDHKDVYNGFNSDGVQLFFCPRHCGCHD